VPPVDVFVATSARDTFTENRSFVQPVKPAIFWTKPPATVPVTQSVVQVGEIVLMVNVPPVIVLRLAGSKRVRLMLTAHAALSPALPLPRPEKVADVDVNAVSTPLTVNVVDDGAATATVGTAANAAVTTVATAKPNRTRMSTPPISCAFRSFWPVLWPD
jgi:hypothetical protein